MSRGKQEPVLSWPELEKTFGAKFCKDAQRICMEKGTGHASAFRRFCQRLSSDARPLFEQVFEYYRLANWRSLPVSVINNNVVWVVTEYIASAKASFVGDWPRTVAAKIGAVLEELCQQHSSAYPPFHSKTLPKFKAARNKFASLGTLNWPGFDHVPPKDRDSAGLKAVFAAALAAVKKAETILGFGQRMLASAIPPENVDPESWNKIRSLVLVVRSDFQKLGFADRSRDFKPFNDRGLWVAAGYPSKLTTTRRMTDLGVLELAISGLGATGSVTITVRAAFCAATGWNKQQIKQLGLQPFAFRHSDAVGIADEIFLTDYKRRGVILSTLILNAVSPTSL